MSNKKLGVKLRTIRQAAGLSLRDAAAGLKMPFPIISEYENGRHMPTEKTMRRFFNFYKLSIREEVEVYAAAGQVHPQIVKYLINNIGECGRLIRLAGIA